MINKCDWNCQSPLVLVLLTLKILHLAYCPEFARLTQGYQSCHCHHHSGPRMVGLITLMTFRAHINITRNSQRK